MVTHACRPTLGKGAMSSKFVQLFSRIIEDRNAPYLPIGDRASQIVFDRWLEGFDAAGRGEPMSGRTKAWRQGWYACRAVIKMGSRRCEKATKAQNQEDVGLQSRAPGKAIRKKIQQGPRKKRAPG